MTRIVIVAAIAIISAGCSSHSPSQASLQVPLRVMSFNVRTSGATADGINAWPNRKELCLSTIRAFAPDLLGTQEVMADQHAALASLPDMQIVGVPREDGISKGEWSALLFRSSRFELLSSGTFWLSETPEVAGSKSWDTSLTRICTWARLRERSTGREILCANTHFDHRGVLARENSAKLLAARLPQLTDGAPIILIGDFNSTDTTPAYQALTKADASPAPQTSTKTGASPALFADSYREIHPQASPDEATFHAFTGKTAGSRIDFIFHTSQLQAVDAQILRTPATNGVFPSDHYPVTAMLRWR
jgi:endonuclease/exonuclease/phosphatase family metal-dependent hydrolase